MVRGFRYTPYNDVEVLRKLLEEITLTPEEDAEEEGRGRLAAIMMEPLQGKGVIRPGTLEYFAECRKLAEEHGALLICEEVQVGMGRLGKLWGHEQLVI